MVLQQPPAYWHSPAGARLAYRSSPGVAPTVVFLPGFMSDMSGAKAAALSQFCGDRGQAFLRFDYRAHGSSEGRFADLGIDDWLQDTLAIIDSLTGGALILVGSSMGGWLALLAALARRDRVVGLVGIAAAPDFTEDLIWAQLSPEERDKLMAEGALHQPSEYGDKPYCFSRKLIEDGRQNLLLGKPIALDCPIRLLHGMADPDVPFATALRLAEAIESRDVVLELIKDGDHRLSRDADLGRICQAVAELTGLYHQGSAVPAATGP